MIRPLLLAAVTLAVSACTTVGTQKTPPPAVVETVSAEAAQAEGARVAALHARSEEHTSELQSQSNLVCRLLLEKKKKTKQMTQTMKQHQLQGSRKAPAPQRR